MANTPADLPAKRDALALVLSVCAWLLLVPAFLLLLLAFAALVTGDGFSDAAPWWVVIGMLAALFGAPGLALLALARLRSRLLARDAARSAAAGA